MKSFAVGICCCSYESEKLKLSRLGVISFDRYQRRDVERWMKLGPHQENISAPAEFSSYINIVYMGSKWDI
jgi:hypothetical protein